MDGIAVLALIAGMPRSGSTFSFNIAKEILKKTGLTEWITSDSTEESIVSCHSKNLLIKNHNMSRFLLGHFNFRQKALKIGG